MKPSDLIIAHSTDKDMENDNIPAAAADELARLDDLLKINPEDEEALLSRGRILWGLGKRSEAIHDYLEARRINPEGKAEQLLKATYAILDYYNKDLYNP